MNENVPHSFSSIQRADLLVDRSSAMCYSSTAPCRPGCKTAPLLSRCAVLNIFDIFPPLQLLLYERNWLNRWKMTVLHEGEGSITNIKWRANLIAWANNVVSKQPC